MEETNSNTQETTTVSPQEAEMVTSPAEQTQNEKTGESQLEGNLTSPNSNKPEEDNKMITNESVPSPSSASNNEETVPQTNLINLTVKTPKEKENVSVRPEATVKEV